MKTPSLLLITITLALTPLARGQTNTPPPMPMPQTNAVLTTSAQLVVEVAELRAAVTEMSQLLEEQRQANTELAVALKSAQSASAQPAPQAAPQTPPKRVVYYWDRDSQRYVPVPAGTFMPSYYPATRSASGLRIVGERIYPKKLGPGYLNIQANGREFQRLAANPRNGQ